MFFGGVRWVGHLNRRQYALDTRDSFRKRDEDALESSGGLRLHLVQDARPPPGEFMKKLAFRVLMIREWPRMA